LLIDDSAGSLAENIPDEHPFHIIAAKPFRSCTFLQQHAARLHNDSIDLNNRMLQALALVYARRFRKELDKEQR
jgi:hypothetical protein